MERLAGRGRSLKDFTYTDKEIADEIYSAMNSTQFLGVSGFVAFSSQGDRIALTQIEQMIDGQYLKLGYYDTQADNLTWLNMERWEGGKVPQDRTIVRTVLRTVSLPLFVCMSTISSCGIFVAIALIVFNIWNNHRRYVKKYVGSSSQCCQQLYFSGKRNLSTPYFDLVRLVNKINLKISTDSSFLMKNKFQNYGWQHWNACCVVLMLF